MPNKLVIASIIIVILLLGIGGYLLLQEFNSQTNEKCGNSICEEKEKGTCPEDCKQQDGQNKGKCGDGICGPVENQKGTCPQDCETTELKSCSKLKGKICSTPQTCSGSWLNASDTKRCCNNECKTSIVQNSDNSIDADGFLWGTEAYPNQLTSTEDILSNTLKIK